MTSLTDETNNSQDLTSETSSNTSLTDESASSNSLSTESVDGLPYRNNTEYRSSNTYRGVYVYLTGSSGDVLSSSTNLTDISDGA